MLNTVQFDQRTHALRCLGCKGTVEIRQSAVINPEHFAQLREDFEAKHEACREFVHVRFRDKSIKELRAWWAAQVQAVTSLTQ